MSEQNGAARSVCDRYAPTLAMLDAPDLDADERRAALEHLAGCPRCQADQRAYARMDADLRRAFGPGVAAPLPTADLLAAIGATHEPTRELPTPATLRSVVDLGNLDNIGRMDRMRDTGRRDGTSAPAHRMEPIPSPRPDLDARLGWRRWTAAFGATAAALVVIVVAVTIFNMRPRIISMPGAITPVTQGHADGAGIVMAVSMDSPTDGWAIGQAYSGPPPTPSASGQATAPEATFYHFNGSAWVQAPSVPGFQINLGSPPSVYLKMFSPTDGWAYGWDSNGVGHLLRYDGVAWRPASISLTGGAVVHYVQTLDMVSPTDGWAAAHVTGGAASAQSVSFLRYDGQRWTLEQSDLALPAGADASQLTITGFSETPGGDVWATGAAPSNTWATGGASTPSATALVFHRVNGVWRVAATLHSASGSINPSGIYMSSPTSGWIIGQVYQNQTSSEGTTAITHALLMRYDGAHWSPVSVPLATVTNYDTLRQIVATGPDNIWINGQSNASALVSGVELSSLLLRYDGTKWSLVSLDAPIHTGSVTALMTGAVDNISIAPDGSLWAVGALSTMSGSSRNVTSPLFLTYRNGAWSVLPVTSGK